MKRVLFKRSLRDLKENWARYTALALLIIFSIYIVLSLVGAATATIDQTAQYDEELNCEDGEFSVFVPLTDSELNRITKKGVDIEKMFFLDYLMEDGSALSGVMLSMFQDSDMFADSTSNLISILKAEDNVRIDAAADDVAINKSAGIMVGILLIILFSYVISVFVVHTIDRESAVIGALYSMGVKKRDLMSHYIVLPVMVTFVSGVFGLILATSRIGIEVQIQDNYNYFSMPNMHPEVSPFMIAYALIFPPVLSAIVNALVIRSRLNRTPLSLLKNEQSFPFYIYVMIYVIIIVLYLIINNALVGKIKKMVPAEVLKNRE